MKKGFTLKQEDFDSLLSWLSADREEAGRQYEKIREGLIRYFRFRGGIDPEALADETINRVAMKLPALDFSKNLKTITYFYGFAANVYLEHRRSMHNREVQLEPDLLKSPQLLKNNDSAKPELDCLDECLKKLSSQENSLVIQYYSLNKSGKFEMRRRLAEKENLKMPALHTKIYRIRGFLKNCVQNCLSENNLS